MNKNEYLSKLDSLLTVLTYDERKDIMYDYEEHFKAGLADGKTEEDIASELGNPESLAAQYITYPTTYEKKNADDCSTTSGSSTDKGSERQANRPSSNYREEPISFAKTTILVFFSIVVGLGLYVAIWGIIISFYAVGIGTAIIALALFIETVTGIVLPYVSHPFQVVMFPALGIMTSIFFASLSGLIMVGSVQFTKFYVRLTNKYIAWGKDFIRRS